MAISLVVVAEGREEEVVGGSVVRMVLFEKSQDGGPDDINGQLWGVEEEGDGNRATRLL